MLQWKEGNKWKSESLDEEAIYSEDERQYNSDSRSDEEELNEGDQGKGAEAIDWETLECVDEFGSDGSESEEERNIHLKDFQDAELNEFEGLELWDQEADDDEGNGRRKAESETESDCPWTQWIGVEKEEERNRNSEEPQGDRREEQRKRDRRWDREHRRPERRRSLEKDRRKLNERAERLRRDGRMEDGKRRSPLPSKFHLETNRVRVSPQPRKFERRSLESGTCHGVTVNNVLGEKEEADRLTSSKYSYRSRYDRVLKSGSLNERGYKDSERRHHRRRSDTFEEPFIQRPHSPRPFENRGLSENGHKEVCFLMKKGLNMPHEERKRDTKMSCGRLSAPYPALRDSGVMKPARFAEVRKVRPLSRDSNDLVDRYYAILRKQSPQRGYFIRDMCTERRMKNSDDNRSRDVCFRAEAVNESEGGERRRLEEERSRMVTERRDAKNGDKPSNVRRIDTIGRESWMRREEDRRTSPQAVAKRIKGRDGGEQNSPNGFKETECCTKLEGREDVGARKDRTATFHLRTDESGGLSPMQSSRKSTYARRDGSGGSQTLCQPPSPMQINLTMPGKTVHKKHTPIVWDGKTTGKTVVVRRTLDKEENNEIGKNMEESKRKDASGSAMEGSSIGPIVSNLKTTNTIAPVRLQRTIVNTGALTRTVNMTPKDEDEEREEDEALRSALLEAFNSVQKNNTRIAAQRMLGKASISAAASAIQLDNRPIKRQRERELEGIEEEVECGRKRRKRITYKEAWNGNDERDFVYEVVPQSSALIRARKHARISYI